MGNSHPLDGLTRDKNVINAMTTELQNILNRHQLVMQRSEELAAQIGIFEKRQEYAQAALEESRRIAAEISSDALQRVNKVMNNAQKVIDPQQVEIASLEAKIAEIKQELAERPSEETTIITPSLAQLPGLELTTPEASDLDLTGPYRSRDDQWHSAPRPMGRISVLEIHPEKNDPGDLELQADLPSANTNHEAGSQAAGSEPNIAPPAVDTYTEPRLEMNLPPMSVYTSERTELVHSASTGAPRELIEERENSSIMHLDVFLDARHFHFVDPWNKQDHRHRWQVKVQVEVPRDEAVAYSQLLSAVTSTLLKYDNVLLNEVYPFDHIDPSHENVAGYFFNCLEDMVAVKGLRMVEVGLWEKQNLVLQVHGRNGDIDAVLRGENDLNQIRESLYHESSADSETSFRKMLGMMFKNRI